MFGEAVIEEMIRATAIGTGAGTAKPDDVAV